jgi:hypothetical protein
MKASQLLIPGQTSSSRSHATPQDLHTNLDDSSTELLQSVSHADFKPPTNNRISPSSPAASRCPPTLKSNIKLDTLCIPLSPSSAKELREGKSTTDTAGPQKQWTIKSTPQRLVTQISHSIFCLQALTHISQQLPSYSPPSLPSLPSLPHPGVYLQWVLRRTWKNSSLELHRLSLLSSCTREFLANRKNTHTHARTHARNAQRRTIRRNATDSAGAHLLIAPLSTSLPSTQVLENGRSAPRQAVTRHLNRPGRIGQKGPISWHNFLVPQD